MLQDTWEERHEKLTSLQGVSMIVLAIALVATTFVPGVTLADSMLNGTITSAAGEKMGGVTVSAKAEGSTITTSVFT